MKKRTTDNVVLLLTSGFLLAAFKMFYLFLDFYNVLDIVVFGITGFIIGGKLAGYRPAFGLLVTLPVVLLCLYFVVRLGYASIMEGVGTSFAVSLILIPLATYVGIFIRIKRMARRSV